MQLNTKSFAFLAFISLFATESILAAAIKKFDSLIVFGDSFSGKDQFILFIYFFKEKK